MESFENLAAGLFYIIFYFLIVLKMISNLLSSEKRSRRAALFT